MHNITFNLQGLHRHGTAFYEYLALRKHFFVDALGWDIPHDERVEMDQYDNPLAWYSLVLRDGAVVGGARTMATTARWGGHSYMLRDALCGKLEDIPASAMPGDVCTPAVWECTRLVISDEVRGADDRRECLDLIVGGLTRVARDNGARELMSLSPLTLQRALRGLGFDVHLMGDRYRDAEDGRMYAVMAMPVEKRVTLMAAE